VVAVADAATAANAGDANEPADIFQRAPRETEALFLLGRSQPHAGRRANYCGTGRMDRPVAILKTPMATEETSSTDPAEQEKIEIPPISKPTAGAATGAVVGAVAGPVGAVVGGVIGAVMGKRAAAGKPMLPPVKATAKQVVRETAKAVKTARAAVPAAKRALKSTKPAKRSKAKTTKSTKRPKARGTKRSSRTKTKSSARSTRPKARSTKPKRTTTKARSTKAKRTATKARSTKAKSRSAARKSRTKSRR
jgi:hypothetical protein